jgi:predicted nucleic acid-binding protein
LAQEIAADFVLVDDQSARSEATRRGVDWALTPDIVRMMKQQGLIPAVKPVLDTMRRNGFGIKRTLYRATLRKSGE